MLRAAQVLVLAAGARRRKAFARANRALLAASMTRLHSYSSSSERPRFRRLAALLRGGLVCAVLCTLLLSACSSAPKQTGSGPTGAPIPLQDLCPVFTQDLCTYLIQCVGAPYCDMSQCLAENTCYGLPQLTEAASAGAVIYDPGKVGDCDARFRSDPCHFATFLFVPDIFEVLAFCPGTITPELGAGEACVSSGECTSGLFCLKPVSRDCPGVCTALAKAGESCAGGVQCETNLLCDDSNVCKPFASAGTPCATAQDCGPIVVCLDDPSCTNPNLWCDTTSGTCKPGVTEGEACSATPAGQTLCAEGLWCTEAFLTKQGTCRALGGAGAPCNPLGGCQQGLHCDGYQIASDTPGQCASPAGLGGACSLATDCMSGLTCDNGACSQLLGVGGACGSDSDCQKGLTCSAGRCLKALCPGAACTDPDATCVLSLCKNGTCQNHAQVGQPCTTGTDCTTGSCLGGTCADTSVCANPG
jgi:hypothetical protein